MYDIVQQRVYVESNTFDELRIKYPDLKIALKKYHDLYGESTNNSPAVKMIMLDNFLKGELNEVI